MKSLGRALSAEVLKLKRTLALWLAVGYPVPLLTLLAFTFILRPAVYLGVAPQQRWATYTSFAFVGQLWAFLMLGLLVTIETTLLAGLEHSDKEWKYLFALPIPRWSVYMAKVVVGMGLVGMSSLVLWAGILLIPLLAGFVRPAIAFAGPVPWLVVLSQLGLVYLAAWLMIALQTWVSVRWSNFVVGIGVGITAVIVGVILSDGQSYGFVHYYPWLFPFFALSSSTQSPVILGVLGGLTFSVIGCWEMTRRDVL